MRWRSSATDAGVVHEDVESDEPAAKASVTVRNEDPVLEYLPRAIQTSVEH